MKSYRQYTFIEVGIEPDDRFERMTREQAETRNWAFEKVKGAMSLMERLVNGDWNDEEFLRVPPGYRIVACYDEGVVTAAPVE